MATAKSASLWAIAGNIGTRGLSFVFFLLIARVLSPAHLGVMALALAVGLFMDAIVEFGLVDQVVRHHDSEDEVFFSSVFWLQMGLAVVCLLLMLLAAPWVARWYKEPDLRDALIGVALACFFTGSGLVPAALLTRRFEQKALAKRNAVATLFGGGLGLGMAYQGAGVHALVALQLVNAMTGSLMVWLSSGWRPRWLWDRQALMPALALARHSLGTRLMDTVINRIDQLMIGSIFGATALGLYALAMRLYDVLFQSICLPIAGVMLPYLAQVARDDAAFKARYLLVLRTTALCVPPLFLCGALFLPSLLPSLFGPKWAAAGPYIQIVLGAGAVLAMSFTHSPAFVALGKPWANLLTSTVATLAWLAALFLLAGNGAIYAAILWAGRGLLASVIQVFLMRRLTGLRLSDYAEATKSVGVAALVVVLVLELVTRAPWLPQGPWWHTVLGGCLSALIFGVAAWQGSDHIKAFVMNRTQKGLG